MQGVGVQTAVLLRHARCQVPWQPLALTLHSLWPMLCEAGLVRQAAPPSYCPTCCCCCYCCHRCRRLLSWLQVHA